MVITLWLLSATPALLTLAGGANLEAAPPRPEGPTVTQKSDSAAQAGEVVFSYSPHTQQRTLREPVFFALSVRNSLDVPVKFDLGQDRKGGFRVVVVRPDGAKVQLPKWRREGIAVIGKLSLDAGQEFTQKFLLNEWFDFAEPGRYEVEVSLTTPVMAGEDGRAVAAQTAGRLVLEISPRDEERLKRVSAALLDGIVKARSYRDAAESALALSHLVDPVAVPDLAKALTSGRMVEPIVIAGLERVGNEEAAQVLIAALNGPNAEVAQLARAALVSIGQKSSDPALKEKISRAL